MNQAQSAQWVRPERGVEEELRRRVLSASSVVNGGGGVGGGEGVAARSPTPTEGAAHAVGALREVYRGEQGGKQRVRRRAGAEEGARPAESAREALEQAQARRRAFLATASHGACRHPYGCVEHGGRRALRAAMAAFVVKAGAEILFALARGRGAPSGAAWSARSVGMWVLGVLRERGGSTDTLRFAAFVSGMVALACGARCATARVRGVDDRWGRLVSGLVGGLAILLDSPLRRSDTALLVAVRAGYALLHSCMRRGLVRRVPRMARWLFCLANAPLVYSLILEPHLLDRSYFEWILRAADIPAATIDRTIREPFYGVADPLHAQRAAYLSAALAPRIDDGGEGGEGGGVFVSGGSSAEPSASFSAPNWQQSPTIATTAPNWQQSSTPTIAKSAPNSLQSPTPTTTTTLRNWQQSPTPPPPPSSMAYRVRVPTDPVARAAAGRDHMTARGWDLGDERARRGVPGGVGKLRERYVRAWGAVNEAVSLAEPPSARWALRALKEDGGDWGGGGNGGNGGGENQRGANVAARSGERERMVEWMVERMERAEVPRCECLPGVVVGPRTYHRCDQLWHPGRSCVRAHTEDIPATFLRSVQIYAPIHLLPLLLFRGQQMLHTPGESALRVAKALTGSSLFLTSYITLVKTVICFLRTHSARDEWWHASLAGVVASAGLVFEDDKRASELMLFVLPKSIEILWQIAERNNVVRRFPGGDVLLFALALATALAVDRKDFRPMYARVLDFLVGS